MSVTKARAFTSFSRPRGNRIAKRLVAAVGGSIWYESSTPGTMIELAAATGTLNTVNDISIFEAFQKVYIANDTIFKVVDFANIKFATADLRVNTGTDFIPTRGMILTGGTSASQMVLDYMDAVDGATTLYGFRTTLTSFASGETVTGTNSAGEAVTFVLSTGQFSPVPPHYYDWTPFGNDTTTYGEMPARAILGDLYRGRTVLAGDRAHPHQWYMARQNNPYDWTYGTLDAQSAVAGSAADAGEIGDILTALVPYKDDYLLFGGTHSIWRMNGDPAAGGRLAEVSLITGIFGARSWSFDDEENFYFTGNGGIFVLPPQVGMTPKDLTEELLPDFWSDWGLDSSLHTVHMAYDKFNHGILLNRTLLSDGTNDNYWIDSRTKGFFPESYPADSGIYSLYNYDAVDPDFQTLILGTKGGYLKQFDATTKNDDTGASTTPIDSSVVFGPILIGAGVDNKSKINLATYALSTDSDGVTSSIFTHPLAEKLIDGIDGGTLSAKMSKTITPTTRSIKNRQKTSGTFLGLRLRNNTASESWGLESIVINVSPSGRF